MRVTGDLGFSNLVLFLSCLAIPVIGLVMRRKWNLALARKEEINRLLILAQEEAARAELEASIGFVPVSVFRDNQCVVCYCPTTTRCARCKSVRYCSGKCQIIHWRQGHKEECHPPVSIDPIRGQGHKEESHPPSSIDPVGGEILSSRYTVTDNHYEGIQGDKSENKVSRHVKQTEAFCKEPPISEVIFTSDEKEFIVEDESLAEEKGADSSSETSGNSFSGFSASNTASESSDDSSVGESMTSDENEKSDGQISVDCASDMFDSASSMDNNDTTVSSSPEFATLVDNDTTSNGADQYSPVHNGGEKKCAPNGSSDLRTCGNNLAKPSLTSLGFWDRVLDSCMLGDDAGKDPIGNNFNESINNKKHYSESSLPFSSGISPPLNAKGPKDKSSMSDGASSDAHSVYDTKEDLPSTVKCGKSCVQHSIAISSERSVLKTSVLKVVNQFRGSTSSKYYPSAGSEIAGRYSHKGLFPYDLFVKLYTWNKAGYQPCGLINCGNSCYANAVLQCLAFTPPLTAYFLQGLHSKACIRKERCFNCEFESLVLKGSRGSSALSPMGIVSQLQKIGHQLGNGSEEDAHEFLRHAIDTMQSVCLMEAGVKSSSLLEEESTLVGLTFGGYLRSKIKCTKCGVKSERQERMMDLTVEIEGDIRTLEEALRKFTSTEILDGENKYYCIRCKSYERAKKKLTVLEAPNVLTIALKRFQSGKFGKLNKPIQFPEILNMAPFMSGTSDKSPIYRLYGVIVHLDVMNVAFSGHYICYVKNIQNKWFKVDDSVVTAVELGRVLTEGAYMLLYARCSPRAPRSIRSRLLPADSIDKFTPSLLNGKATPMKSRSLSTNSGVTHRASSNSPYSSATPENFHSKFKVVQRILEEDSSDNLSLISNNSDEGSCSTDSTRDSTSTDDFSDYLFGDSGQCWNSPWRSMDSNTSPYSSCSKYWSHSPLANIDRHASCSAEAIGSQIHADSTKEVKAVRDRLHPRKSTQVNFECADAYPSHPEISTQYRKFESISSSGINSGRSCNNFRDTNLEKVGFNPSNHINSGVHGRKTRERTG